MSRFADLFRFIKTHKLLSVAFCVIPAIVLLILIVFLQNRAYLATVASPSDAQISSFINSSSNRVMEISYADPAEDEQYPLDRFAQVSTDLYYRWGEGDIDSGWAKRKFDYAFCNDTGRFRMICFEFSDYQYASGTAEKEFLYFTLGSSHAKIQSPWLGIVKSESAEFYWNDEDHMPYVLTWYYGNSFIVLLSDAEDPYMQREVGRQMKRDIIRFVKEQPANL